MCFIEATRKIKWKNFNNELLNKNKRTKQNRGEAKRAVMRREETYSNIEISLTRSARGQTRSKGNGIRFEAARDASSDAKRLAPLTFS